MKKIIAKSWENDGDNNRTKSMTVDSREEAQKIKKICKELFASCNSSAPYGIGNSMDGESDETITDYIEDHPEMKLTEAYINQLACNLLGGSEWYDYRVCES